LTGSNEYFYKQGIDMTEECDAGESIYRVCLSFIEEHAERFEPLMTRCLSVNNFTHLGGVMVQSDANNCLMAGAIARRKYRDSANAFRLWAIANRPFLALERGVEARMNIPPDFKFDRKLGQYSEIPLAYFIELTYCLLFNGDRQRLNKLQTYFDLPFVTTDAGDGTVDAYAYETLIIFAAWEGNIARVESLTPDLQKYYSEWKIDKVYTQLWHAVAARQSDVLDQLLPEAEASYKRGARRRDQDIWGGDKNYINAMFDVYTTAVLKIAKAVGMSWTYGNNNTAEIWPQDVIDHWPAEVP